MWKESRADAVSLLRTRSLFSVPIFILSLLAVITAVNSASLAYHNKRPSFHTAVKAVKESWKRPFVTSICVYAVMSAVAVVLRILTAFVDSAGARFAVAVVGTVFEVYLMAVLSLGLVVSVMEDRFGFDAIWVGSTIMEGRRFNGWVLSGLIVLMSGGIGWQLEGLMDGQELLGKSYSAKESTAMMVIMGFGDKVGLVCLFGLEVIWSFVVNTVFYRECRKRHVLKNENETIDDNDNV